MKYYLTVKRECDHVCESDCRRDGCNCACGEFHFGEETLLEVVAPNFDLLSEKVGAWERSL